MNREQLGRTLREARENRGMSQQAVSARLGLSRTVIAQIELGNRAVSSEELSKLAAVYRRPVSDFSRTTAHHDDEDVVARVFRVEPALPARLKPYLEHIVNLCHDAVALEGVLGRSLRIGPPQYGVAQPRNTADAIVQGEQVAEQERQRLGLGLGSPIGGISEVVASQGVRVAVLKLPEDVLGIFLRDRSIGSIIITPPDPMDGTDSGASRFGLLHGYGLALFETAPAIVTTLAASDELAQMRADAFAAAFLLPRSGLESAIAGLDKGRPSRRSLAVFGLAAEEAAEAVVRSTPGSQTLTCHDIAVISRRFGSRYKATVHRLRSLDLISKPEFEQLLSEGVERAAAVTTALLLAKSHRDQPHSSDEAIALKSEVALLSIEAYRRQLIAKVDLTALATKLKVPELTPAKLVELAEAAR